MLKRLVLNAAKYAPFLLHAVKWSPRFLVFAVTGRCNCRCVMCRYWEMEQRPELTTDEIKGILGQAHKAGVKSVTFYGGEPLLRPDLAELVGFARFLRMRTGIITNGLLADRDSARHLVGAGLDKVVVSLDAFGERQGEVRGVEGAYERAVKGIDAFLAAREGGRPRIFVAALLMGLTIGNDGLLRIVDVALQKGIPVLIELITFSFFYFRGIGPEARKRLWIGEERWSQLDELVDRLIAIKKETPWLIANSSASLRYIKSYFRDPESRSLPCYRAYGGTVWVDAQGKVYGCQGLPALGDLRREAMANVIGSGRWRRGIREMFMKKCPGCSCDYSSNVDADLARSWMWRAEAF